MIYDYIIVDDKSKFCRLGSSNKQLFSPFQLSCFDQMIFSLRLVLTITVILARMESLYCYAMQNIKLYLVLL